MSKAPVLAIGLMSGTSLDGMDAALVQISGPDDVRLRGFAHRGYSISERTLIESVLAGGPIAELARLHALIGEWSAEAVAEVLAGTGCSAGDIAYIAFPGQTVWHEPPVVTLQLGSAAIVAERFGITVVHDFRSRDVAAGGQGAPLVPLADALCFSSAEHPRILLNLGGMANVTWLPAGGGIEGVVAGDTGPGMAVIDAMSRFVDPQLPWDAGGRLARQGEVSETVLGSLLNEPFFELPPPRSTGRELFGADYAARLHRRLPGVDGVRTAVELTARSVVEFCVSYLPPAPELVAAGGGTHHPVLMARIAELLDAVGTSVRSFDELYFRADAKEAVAFALLGWHTLEGRPGNIPAVTGAAGPRVLGSVLRP